jgi:hypothetical protein
MLPGHLRSPASKTLCRCICDCSWFRSSTSLFNRWSLEKRPAVSGCETRIDARLRRNFTPAATLCSATLTPKSISLLFRGALFSLLSVQSPNYYAMSVGWIIDRRFAGSSITLVDCRCRSISKAGPRRAVSTRGREVEGRECVDDH